jgi:hypothetical protein
VTTTHRKHFESVIPHVVAIPSPHVVDADQQTVVHHTDAAQELCVASYLFRQQCSLFWAELEQLAPINPIEILEHCSRICSSLFFGILPPNRAPFEIVGFMDVPMGRE